MDPEKVKAALEALKNQDADAALALLEDLVASAASGGESAADSDAAPDDAATSMAEAPDPPAEDDEEEKTAASLLKRLAGTESIGEAAHVLTGVIADVRALKRERAALDLSSRKELIARLVKLGVEIPSTAWDGDPDARKPVKRLLDEPLADLRSRVEKLERDRPAAHRPPAGDAPEVKVLSAAHAALAKKAGIDPAEFAARKAAAVRRV